MSGRWFWSRAALLGLSVWMSACDSPNRPSPPPPSLTINCPANMSSASADGNPVVVSFATPQASGGSTPVTTTCTPQSGSQFPVGSSTVICEARDARIQVASCSFAVAVTAPPRLTATRFLAFGDSLTEGVHSVSPTFLIVSPSWSYPFQLQNRLVAQYRLQTPVVINEGVAGELASVDGVRRFRSVLQANRPDVVLLMEGTNDLLFGETGASNAINALSAMIREAKSQGIRIALSTVPPQRAGGRRDAVAGSIPGFNDRIRALAASEGIPLVEVFNGMTGDNSLIGPDDLHMTDRGYEIMADIYLERDQSQLRRAGDVHRVPLVSADMPRDITPGATRGLGVHATAPAGKRFEERDDYGNYEANLRFLREAGLTHGTGRLLEIGSGKGRMLDLLRREGFDAQGVEVNHAMIQESRRLYGDLPIQQVDGATLPFGDEAFSTVVSFDVFEHIPDSDAHLREVKPRAAARRRLPAPDAEQVDQRRLRNDSLAQLHGVSRRSLLAPQLS